MKASGDIIPACLEATDEWEMSSGFGLLGRSLCPCTWGGRQEGDTGLAEGTGVGGVGAGTCTPMRCTPSGHLELARNAPH